MKKFNTTKQRRSVDSESRKPRVSNRNPKFQQKSFPEHSSDDHVSSDEDSEIESELDIPVKDDSRRPTVNDKKPRKREEKDTAKQKAHHSSKESKTTETSVVSSPHMIMRASVYHMKIAPITFPTASTYIPSFYMYYFTINSAHNIVHNNTYLKYLAPQYITIASSLYYGIIGYIQILRAKTVAGIITRPESQALRRFEKEFPFESLPIMSPLVMFFQNLGAVKLADPMYSWICPTLPTQLGTASNVDGIFAASANIMLPNVPALIRFLYEIGTAADIATITDANHMLAPASRVAGNNDFFGINLAANMHNNANNQRLLYSAGWLSPPEIPESLDVTLIRRIQRWQLPQLTSATNLSDIGQFLQLDGNYEWFKNLVNLCTQEARFFKGSTNLANIPPTTGLSSLIEVKTSSDVRPAARDTIYPFSHSGFSSNLWRFTISTTRGETNQDECQIGATTQFLTREFNNLVPNGHATPAPTSSGSYFLDDLGGRQVDQIESDQTRSPKMAFEQIIRENLYDETGGQPKRT
jgi:hypothetical protein